MDIEIPAPDFFPDLITEVTPPAEPSMEPAAFDLGLNRSMQHITLCVSPRSVADEAETKNLLFGSPEGGDVGAVEERRVTSSNCPVV